MLIFAPTWVGNFNLNLVFFVVRPVAWMCLWVGRLCCSSANLLCVILDNYLLPSLRLRLLLFSIALGAVDLDDRMVFH